MESRPAVEVALPLPLQIPFSYGLPAGEPMPARGIRVVVPFGPRRVIGVVTGPAPTAGPGDAERPLKDVLQILDEAPLVPPPLLDLAAFVADHYLAPPGECYRLVLPPAGVRASRAVVRLAKPGGADDPLLKHLQSGPLRLSALEKRFGRDPLARLSRLRREGTVAVEQSLDAPGFRELQVAVLEAAGEPALRGKAQVEAVARLRAAGGRARVSDLVEDRPALRGAPS